MEMNWTYTLKKHKHLTRQALSYNILRKRKVGKHTHTWRKNLHKKLTQLDYSWSKIKHKTQDRKKWKTIVKKISEEG